MTGDNLGRDTTGVRRRRTFTFHGNKTQAQRRLRELVADFERGIRAAQSIRLFDCLVREGHSPKSIGLMHTVLSGPYR